MREICTLRVNGRGLETGLTSGTAPVPDPTAGWIGIIMTTFPRTLVGATGL